MLQFVAVRDPWRDSGYDVFACEQAVEACEDVSQREVADPAWLARVRAIARIVPGK